MLRYLSEGWFAQLGPADARDGAPRDLVLQHHVSGGPEGDVDYHVEVGEDRFVVRPGRSPRAAVTFTEDYLTAAAVARGELSASTALAAGRIRVQGDLAALIAHKESLAPRDLIPQSLRDTTTY